MFFNEDDYTFNKEEVMRLSPLILAFIGDSIYDLFIRRNIAVKGNRPLYKIHKECVKYVKAEAQAESLKRISKYLIDDEKDIVRRGRNVKSATIPKHADIEDYHLATAFEALLGYLYLLGKIDRLKEILELTIESNNEKGE
ncbi:Mini-ribonuclease 3 [Aceticella autotrophica]|uniref:Mini-ribonuclease 3 n=1 Tax=Aceticella autotrophica TaxID=2755338 RepID=A0A975GAK3_9THEO|nr:ribonuclease III domain-containing protein [Aceticella autotrophica]QSZ27177.1 Mini-ribonuclease 3 [Aceticella autotrophica]